MTQFQIRVTHFGKLVAQETTSHSETARLQRMVAELTDLSGSQTDLYLRRSLLIGNSEIELTRIQIPDADPMQTVEDLRPKALPEELQYNENGG